MGLVLGKGVETPMDVEITVLVEAQDFWRVSGRGQGEDVPV